MFVDIEQIRKVRKSRENRIKLTLWLKATGLVSLGLIIASLLDKQIMKYLRTFTEKDFLDATNKLSKFSIGSKIKTYFDTPLTDSTLFFDSVEDATKYLKQLIGIKVNTFYILEV